MSDLYDSLEDESNGKNSPPGSLNEYNADAWNVTPKNKTPQRKSFYLNSNQTKPEPDLHLAFQEDGSTSQEKKNSLPKIETKGPNTTPNQDIDEKILREQGLQLNNDGSFTKSPRPFAEELPFITREYRNLQFQKKKTYKMMKIPPAKTRKNIFSVTENPVIGIGMNKITSGRRKKVSSEEILTSAGTVPSAAVEPTLLPRDNMTDSMKEKLLLSKRNTPGDTTKLTGSIKYAKRGLNLSDIYKTTQQYKFPNLGTKTPGTGNSDCKQEHLPQNKKKLRPISLMSDIPPNAIKCSLSYLERRQQESGFNPLHLRLENKKVLSDSNRSNFGDSAVDELPEVSSRIVSSENRQDENEEMFYRKLMQKDREQTPSQRSTRSEGPCDFPKLKNSTDSGSTKDPSEMIRNLRFKSKPLSIDLPPDSHGISQVLKKNHYCSVDSSSLPSRYELVMKARTYGYLANARNIFKMKAQSEAKVLPKEGDGNPQIFRSGSRGQKAAEVKKLPSKSALPQVENKFSKALDKMAATKKPLQKTDKGGLSEMRGKGIVLPPVVGPDESDSKIEKEILNQMSLCLNGAQLLQTDSSTVK